jgi:hypothetical protein
MTPALPFEQARTQAITNACRDNARARYAAYAAWVLGQIGKDK